MYYDKEENQRHVNRVLNSVQNDFSNFNIKYKIPFSYKIGSYLTYGSGGNILTNLPDSSRIAFFGSKDEWLRSSIESIAIKARFTLKGFDAIFYEAYSLLPICELEDYFHRITGDFCVHGFTKGEFNHDKQNAIFFINSSTKEGLAAELYNYDGEEIFKVTEIVPKAKGKQVLDQETVMSLIAEA